MGSSAAPILAPTAPPSAGRVSVHAALYAALYGGGRALERAGKLWFYAAAGALTLDDLRRAALRQWDEFAAMQGEDDTAFLDWEGEFYRQFLRAGDRVLLVGCGSGRDLIALLEHGCRADGVDPVPGCITAAAGRLAKRGLTARLYTGWIEDAALDDVYDAVVFSWDCYGLIPHAATRIAVLRAVRNHVAAGGRVLLSYVAAGRPPRPFLIRTARLVSWLSRSDWRPEIGDVVVPTDAAPDGAHYEHHFRPEEVEREVRAAGLSIVHHSRVANGLGVLTAE